MVESVQVKPSSVAEAIGLVATSSSFNRKSEKLIRKILGSHINAESTEYTQITEDAISEVSTKMFEQIASGPIDEEWYLSALETYGESDCTVTRYMYKSVGNYAKTRHKRWSMDEKTGKLGVRAREVYSVSSDDETERSFEDWLMSKVGELNENGVEKNATQFTLTEILKHASIPSDVIDMILLKCEGEKYKVIGAKFGLSEDAVRMRLKRVRAALADSPFLQD